MTGSDAVGVGQQATSAAVVVFSRCSFPFYKQFTQKQSPTLISLKHYVPDPAETTPNVTRQYQWTQDPGFWYKINILFIKKVQNCFIYVYRKLLKAVLETVKMGRIRHF